VMLGGAVTDDGARFGRIAAKVPARRIPQVIERLIRLYTEDRRSGEDATTFFGRVELARAKERLKGLEEITPANATNEDYVDLGETQEFKPETMDGECAA
jgi:sulfite reductase beta subunit-like hemoprotein